MHDGNNVSKFALESRVEVGAALDCSQAVAVGQFGEDADVAVVFKLETWRSKISGLNFAC